MIRQEGKDELDSTAVADRLEEVMIELKKLRTDFEVRSAIDDSRWGLIEKEWGSQKMRNATNRGNAGPSRQGHLPSSMLTGPHESETVRGVCVTRKRKQAEEYHRETGKRV